MTKEHIVYLALGSNLGDRRRAIRQAVARIAEQIGPVERQSSLYETQPWGFSSPHTFINACICCRTTMSPLEVLRATQRIEKEMGRVEKTHDEVYQDRCIDIDILLFDHLNIQTPELTIPHRLMHEREFVMVPLREILKEGE